MGSKVEMATDWIEERILDKGNKKTAGNLFPIIVGKKCTNLLNKRR